MCRQHLELMDNITLNSKGNKLSRRQSEHKRMVLQGEFLITDPTRMPYSILVGKILSPSPTTNCIPKRQLCKYYMQVNVAFEKQWILNS